MTTRPECQQRYLAKLFLLQELLANPRGVSKLQVDGKQRRVLCRVFCHVTFSCLIKLTSLFKSYAKVQTPYVQQADMRSSGELSFEVGLW
jgi:hypothetical protein